jgi:drug/metabolite transporter (DMT)-like permease
VTFFGAITLALASAVCYAVSAVIQHREASRPAAGGRALLAELVRRRRWWGAVAASIAGALLHVAALGAGPLVLVQPLGVSTLVFALVIGARSTGADVSGRAALGAACVVVGLPMLLLVIPRHAHVAFALIRYRWAAAAVFAVAVAAVAAGRLYRLRPPVAAACYAVGAATCFGLASGTVRAVWLRHGTPAMVLTGLTAAGIGIALAQYAYRDGGLGAPLATLTLVDPLSATALGVLVLGESLNLSPTRILLATIGGSATVLGVVLLSLRQPDGSGQPRRHRSTRAPAQQAEPTQLPGMRIALGQHHRRTDRPTGAQRAAWPSGPAQLSDGGDIVEPGRRRGPIRPGRPPDSAGEPS